MSWYICLYFSQSEFEIFARFRMSAIVVVTYSIEELCWLEYVITFTGIFSFNFPYCSNVWDWIFGFLELIGGIVELSALCDIFQVGGR